VSPRRLLLLALAAAGLWLLFRPKTLACPQCKGRGAPPLVVNGAPRARLCGTCGASSTPDLPLVGEADPVVEEA
jgi:hypothetical protein